MRKKQENDPRKVDVNISLDLLGFGEVSENTKEIVETIMESNKISKVKYAHLLFLIIMIIVLVALVIVSKQNIPAFANFPFVEALFFWAGAMSLYGLVFFITGFFEKE